MNLPSAFASADSTPTLALHIATPATFSDWEKQQPAHVQAWLHASGIGKIPGIFLILPDQSGQLTGAIAVVEDFSNPHAYAFISALLPAGTWKLASELNINDQRALSLGWGLGQYQFTRYKKPARPELAKLVVTADFDQSIVNEIHACYRVRDLVNTPTEDMGPEQMEAVVREIASQHQATVNCFTGEELLRNNFPAIYAVGRASHRAPRLIHLQWGNPAHKTLALVGKGVCFDTGGLDIKPAEGMRNMKKDMGGAAHAIALAELIMAQQLPVHLDLYISAVENAIGPNAYRPGEVIATRKGFTVEIDNTDAEGRVVLCDALTYASEFNPDLLIDFATLTGAARIALGPDLPALYSNHDEIAQAWLDAGLETYDPLWRMPLWRPYRRYLISQIADFANGAPTKMAGSITAALYLERFVPDHQVWAHVDVYSWNDINRPGQPAGGEAQSLRAAYAMLSDLYTG